MSGASFTTGWQSFEEMTRRQAIDTCYALESMRDRAIKRTVEARAEADRLRAEVERLRAEEWSIWDQGAITAIESVDEWIDDNADDWRIHGNPYDKGNPYRIADAVSLADDGSAS